MSMRAKKVRSSRASFSNWEIGSQGNGTGWTGISGSLKDKYKNKYKYKYKYKYKFKTKTKMNTHKKLETL